MADKCCIYVQYLLCRSLILEKQEKLLRPLHRQRNRRRKRATVLSSSALATHYGVDPEQLEAFMNEKNLPFHKDSCGEIWASVSDKGQTRVRALWPPKGSDP